MYSALLICWIPIFLDNTFFWLEGIVFGYPTSRFLSDLALFTIAGYFLAFSIPVLLKYALLVLYTRSIDSRIILIEFRSGDGLWKRPQSLTLGVFRDGPNH